MRGIKLVLAAGFVAMVLGTFISNAESAITDPPVTPTINCNTARDCPMASYCHPLTHICYQGIGQVCTSDAQCTAPGAVCHVFRCHAGGSSCQSNADCPSTTYCHYGLCHAESCTSNNDCPLGVPCIIGPNVCALP